MEIVLAGALILMAVTIMFLSLRPPSAYVRGKQGQFIVRGLLRQLDPMQYDIFHDIMVPCTSTTSGGCQVDHVVVGPSAIFVIETTNIQGALHGKRKDMYWTQVIGMQRRRIYSLHRQSAAHVNALQRNFPDLPKNVWCSVIAVPNSLRLYVEEISGSHIVQFSHLSDFIIRINGRMAQPLPAEERESLIRALIRWKRHRSLARWLIWKRLGHNKRELGHSLEVANGRCPVCGSGLEVVRDDHGSKMICTGASCTFETNVLAITALRQPRDRSKT